MAEITYSGLYNVPSDYECADGQLATSLNLVPENGSLQPIFPPSLIFTLPEGYKVAYIHKTTAFTHYIITRADDIVDQSGSLYWIDKDDAHGEKKDISDECYHELEIAWTMPLSGEDVTIVAIQAVGNTLIVATTTDLNYYLWKTDEDNNSYYQYLGTHLPELNLSFGLQGELIRQLPTDEDEREKQKISGDGKIAYYGFEIELTEEITKCDWETFKGENEYRITDDNKDIINERVFAQVNKFIADHSTNVGRFIFPFIVRYAYRLYDGNITMHSAPILMLAGVGCSPTVYITGYNIHKERSSFIFDWNTGVSSLYCTIEGIAHSLDYIALHSQTEIDKIHDTWGDIIKSVDIFVSAPLYNYDQSGEIEFFVQDYLADEEGNISVDLDDESIGYSICRPRVCKDQTFDKTQNHSASGIAFEWEDSVEMEDEEGDKKDYYCLNGYGRCNMEAMSYFTFLTPSMRIKLPYKTDDTIEDEVKSCCNFYLLKRIKIEDLATTRTIIDIPKDYLQSLVAREQMTDDYDSHDTLLPTFLYNYNNRLDMANITKKVYEGYHPASAFCYANSYINFTESRSPQVWTTQLSEYAEIYVYIKQDSKVIITRAYTSEGLLPILSNIGGKCVYYYYPNTNAYKAILYFVSFYGGYYQMDLEPHDFLNGALFFNKWENPPEAELETDEYGAPKTPQVTSDQTVSVANKLYLSEINNPFFFPVEQIVTVGTGTILGIATAAKPLSQGQFGSFPLYAFCDDGVWALSVNNEGIYSAVQPITRDVCINEKAITQLDSSVLFPTDRGIMQISSNAATCITDVLNGDNAYDITQLPHYEQLLRLAGITDEIAIKPIREFLETGVMLYDYTNQRIYVCSPDCNYAYVISTKSQEWGMAVVDISSVVNSYPDAYAMTDNGDFVDFSHPDDGGQQNTFLITRPMKLDAPNVLKTVTSTIQRGFFDKKHIQSVLWGSRDLLHWHTIRTSQSHEIRAFAGTPYKYFRIAVLAQLEYGESLFGATLQATPRLTNKAR